MDTEQSAPEKSVGYVLDIACLRRYPRGALLEKARSHSRACGLVGHCVESGYALIERDGAVVPLDSAATPLVLDAIRQSRQEAGIVLEVTRMMHDGEMKTNSVREVGDF